MKIFINPGHCPIFDSGACGFGMTEADTTLAIGRMVRDFLSKVGYEVELFQYDGLDEIVEECDDWQADLFVSIHCNAFDGKARGTETFFYNSAEGEKLAACIQRQIVDRLCTVDRGVKEDKLFVLRYTSCPAVLVETAFIDNVHDNELLAERQEDFARAIAVGITDYVKEISK